MGKLLIQPEISRENNVAVFDAFSIHYNKDYTRLAFYALSPSMERRMLEGEQTAKDGEKDVYIELPTSACVQMNHSQSIQLMANLAAIIKLTDRVVILAVDGLDSIIKDTEDFLKYLKGRRDERTRSAK